jgi:hypothetical protein
MHSREEEQTVDDVQPGKIADRIGHSRGSDVEVAPGTGGISLSTGVGRSRAIRMTLQSIQEGSQRGGGPCETWPTLQQEQPEGTIVGLAGRVYASCKPQGQDDR